MYKFICLLIISFNVLCNSVECNNDTELLLTFLVHRHGDRTPIEASIVLSNDPEALVSATAEYGYGQLTDVGRRRGYALGQFIRKRYDSLLSPSYNKSEIYVRSTDSTRTKMTVLAAMAAVYLPTGDNWSDDIKWTPVPYTTVPAKYDFNLATVNCPVFLSKFASLQLASFEVPALAEYSEVLDQWSNILGMNITNYPFIIYILNDVYVSQMSLGLSLDPKIEELYPEIEKIAGIALDYIFSVDDMAVLQAGVLLNQFFTVADQVIAGEDVQRVQIFSAHDLNVFAFETVTEISNKQGVPKYASAYALELRRVIETGAYVIVPVYLNTPSDEVTYLDIAGCEGLCDLETFREVTSKNILEEDEWRTKCEFSEDYVFDTASID